MPGICTGGGFWRPRPGSGPFGKLRRWHAIWLLAQGWTASGTAQALGRDPHTVGRWAAALIFEQSGSSPFLSEAQQAEFKASVKEPPARSGIELANWNWKVVNRFGRKRWGVSRSGEAVGYGLIMLAESACPPGT